MQIIAGIFMAWGKYFLKIQSLDKKGEKNPSSFAH